MPYTEPYVPKALTFEIPERITVNGTVRTPLDEDAVIAVLDKLKAAKVALPTQAAMKGLGVMVRVGRRWLVSRREYASDFGASVHFRQTRQRDIRGLSTRRTAGRQL